MSYLLALIVSLSALVGMPAQPATLSPMPAIEAPIKASEHASLPTYLPQVSTIKAHSDLATEDTTDPVKCEEDMPCWGCATMGNASCTPISQPAQTCEEDMPCWNCETMGNKQCAQPATMEDDAYASFDAQFGQPANTDEMKLSYVSTSTTQPTNLAAVQFAVPSSNLAGVWHIMQWDSIRHT